jgi:hypothetical protein
MSRPVSARSLRTGTVMLAKKISSPTSYQPAANIACTPLRIVSPSALPSRLTIITGNTLAGM